MKQVLSLFTFGIGALFFLAFLPQFVAADFDHDGDIDLASAGKLGVHVLENLKVSKVPKEVREEMQPLERKWPFPGEGKEVPQEDGPTPQ